MNASHIWSRWLVDALSLHWRKQPTERGYAPGTELALSFVVRQRMAAWHRLGVDFETLAAWYDLTPRMAHRYVATIGLRRPRLLRLKRRKSRTGRVRSYSPEVESSACALRNRGSTYQEIANRLGLSVATAQRILSRAQAVPRVTNTTQQDLPCLT